MDKFDYNNARSVAEGLIKKFGQVGTFYKEGSKGGYDQFGDVIPDEPDTIISGTVTPLLQFKTNEIDGTNILNGDSYVFFHSETAPEIDFYHEQNGEKYRAVDIYDMTSADGINVFRRIQLRR